MIPVPQVQNQILEVAQIIPQERVRRITEQIVDASATDHAENVEVIQLVPIALEQIEATPNATDHG